jgi:hypothetical protein
MALMTVNRDPSSKDLRQFAWVMLGGMSLLAALAWWRGRAPETGWAWAGGGWHILSAVFAVTGVAFCAGTLASRAAGRRLYVTWMTGASRLGTVMTYVVMTVLFVTLLPVFSLIRFKDPLRMKLRKSGETYWEDYPPHEHSLERTIRPF